MTDEEIAIFNDSFERCMKDSSFFDIFYDTFLGRSKEVAAKFEHTDFRRQKRVLKSSLYLTMFAAVRKKEDLTFLEPLAERHSSRQLDISPNLYPLWLDSLVSTVARSDPAFDGTVAVVWRQAMQPAIDFMIARY